MRRLDSSGELPAPEPAFPAAYAAHASQSPVSSIHRANQQDRALLLIDGQRTINAISSAAIRLLGVPDESLQGQPLESLADGALSAVALRPNARKATTVFALPDGQQIQATTRPVFDRQQRFAGWMVELMPAESELDELPVRAWSQQETLPTLSALQGQIEHMQTFITMLPSFSQHHQWRHLLIEHMEQLIANMSSQVMQLVPDDTTEKDSFC